MSGGHFIFIGYMHREREIDKKCDIIDVICC